ncbi:hypothetical protein ACIHEJ_09790 [Streptomyces sp. NPDC052301]|uniref:hypothetical protein n=1 Tax=Streptomyces sp. NPDC052301 TaxID=3365687 RepID=UPI0037CDDA24
MHPRPRDLLNTLAGRVSERCELLRWPGTSQALIADVREGRLAFALTRLPISDPDWTCCPSYRNGWERWCRPTSSPSALE